MDKPEGWERMSYPELVDWMEREFEAMKAKLAAVEKALATAKAEGRREMREHVARWHERRADRADDTVAVCRRNGDADGVAFWVRHRDSERFCAKAIRSLPTEPAP